MRSRMFEPSRMRLANVLSKTFLFGFPSPRRVWCEHGCLNPQMRLANVFFYQNIPVWIYFAQPRMTLIWISATCKHPNAIWSEKIFFMPGCDERQFLSSHAWLFGVRLREPLDFPLRPDPSQRHDCSNRCFASTMGSFETCRDSLTFCHEHRVSFWMPVYIDCKVPAAIAAPPGPSETAVAKAPLPPPAEATVKGQF